MYFFQFRWLSYKILFEMKYSFGYLIESNKEFKFERSIIYSMYFVHFRCVK